MIYICTPQQVCKKIRKTENDFHIFLSKWKTFSTKNQSVWADDMIKESMFISAKKAIYSDCTV